MAYLYDLTDTWNAAGTVFNAIKMNVTNTASAAGSKIVSLQVGATDRFTVDKDGNGYFSGTLQAIGSISSPNVYIGANSGTIGMQDNSASILAYNGTGSGGITNTLRFNTAATERMRIDSSGNVGIGTSSPTTKLMLAGSAGSNIYTRWSNGSQELYAGISSGSTALVGTLSNDPLLFYANSSERMRITAAGNVGIGTSSPGAKLEVNGSVRFVDSSAAGPDLLFGNVGGGTSINNVANARTYIGAYETVFTNYDNSTERMRIDSSGNVGIGTSSPGTRLDVASAAGSSTAYTALFRSTNTNGYSGIIGIGVAAATAGAYTAAAFAAENSNGTANDGGRLKFYTAADDASHTLTERMRIDSSGNVGIGTSSPGSKLHIAAANTAGSDNTGNVYITTTDAQAADVGGKLTLGGFYNGSSTYAFGGIAGRKENSTSNNVAGYLQFLTTTSAGALTERARIDSSGNLLVGRTSGGGGRLEVDGNYIRYGNSASYTNDEFLIQRIAAGVSLNTRQNVAMVFSTNDTERARIDSSGNLLVGTTTASAKMSVEGAGVAFYARRTTAGGTAVFRNGDDAGYGISFENSSGTVAGSIYWTATTTTYATSSDARLKHDIVDAPEASALIDAIKVRSFKWNADNSEQRYGMVAQELLEVAPEAVSVPADEEAMMGVDYSKLVPMLVKELQSVRARLAVLEDKA